MGAIYARIPTVEELAGTGFTPEDYETDPVEVWPENMLAINLYLCIQTQWNALVVPETNRIIYIGLDQNVILKRMDRMNLSDSEYEVLDGDMRTIEAEALSILNKKD